MNLKIGTRLNATFACVLAFMLMLCVVVSGLMSKMQDNLNTIVNDRLPLQNLAKQGAAGANYTALYVFRGVAEKTPEAMRADLEKIEVQRAKNKKTYETLQTKLEADPNGRKVLDNIIAARQTYNKAVAPAYKKLGEGDAAGAFEAQQSAMDLREEMMKAQEALVDYEQKAMDVAIADSAAAYQMARYVLWGTFGAALVASVILCMLVKRSIVVPLSKVVDGANALAAGDLSIQVDLQRRDEVGELAESVNTAVVHLAGLVGKVKAASDSIASASQQVAIGASDLSQRTEEQAASLEETTGSMEELTATVRQNADNAKQANTLANAASTVAERGGVVVSRVVSSMEAISSSSARMTEIIGVIEGIAFQTNILALNAAVEAARAGEHGRGFNVVASEVRALAQRSAAAAKEVKVLIGQSETEVREGSALVEQAGATIREVVASVKRVTDLMAEVSAASSEQSANIEQVNRTIAQMDQVTQQNAALVEETAAASDSMASQANELHHAIGAFKLAKPQQAGSGRIAPRIASRAALAA